MKNRRTPSSRLGLAAATATAATLAACAAPALAPQTPPAAGVGLANPASVYCVQQGGRLEIVHGPNGEQGVCHLPNGSTIEEWALYRRDHPER